MPVAAKLSRRFYDAFGDEITNELVEWFNLVDATYRSELRELNELNFGRFRAELRQGVAEVKAELRQELAEAKGELRSGMHVGFADLRGEVAALRGEIGKWMFVFWAGSMVTNLGIMLAVVRILKT